MSIKGFTLIEVMIAVTIIAILAGIAYPLYSEHITNARRIEGKIALLQLADNLERYYSEHHTYKDVTFEKIGMKPFSLHDLYNLEIVESSLTDSSFLIQAIPSFSDECAILTLDQAGKRGMTGSGNCW